jgi:hypothetical protein
MTKIEYTLIIFFIFFAFSMETGKSSCSYLAGCCCNSTVLNQKKCYTSGECCRMDMSDEYWNETGCRDFNVWVEPRKIMLTLGTKTPVILYIDNFGSYTDAYNVNYEIIPVGSNSINVDLTGSIPTGNTGNVAGGETKKLYPLITVFTALNTWDVTFNVSSIGDPTMYRTAKLSVLQSEYPLSLPDFSIFGLIEIVVLVGIIYLVNRIS